MKYRSSRGFTLIELLIVIAIIGVLTTIVLVSISNARSKSRNAVRDADNKSLSTAFALGLASAPLPVTAGWKCVSATCYGGWSGYVADPSVDAYLAPFINKPVDPANSSRLFGGYIYNSNYSVTGLDGTYYPPSAYILWLLEPPRTSTSCGGGKVFWWSSTYVECILRVSN